MSEKIPLKDKIQAIDLNLTSFWDELDDTQKKDLKKEFFILNRYISSVGTSKYPKYTPSREEQEHFVLTVNEYYNKHWNTLSDHPKLFWLLLCACSIQNGKSYYHEWIPLKYQKGDNKKIKFLEELYPNKKTDELQLLSKIMTKEDFVELAKQYGLDDKEIAKEFK